MVKIDLPNVDQFEPDFGEHFSSEEDSGLSPVKPPAAEAWSEPEGGPSEPVQRRTRGPNKVTPLYPDDGEKPRRGRKPNSARVDRDIGPYVGMLIAGHGMASAASGSAVWLINDDEARELVTRSMNVMDAYGVKMDGKNTAVAALIGAALMIYGPRCVSFVMDMRKARTAPKTG